MLHVSKETSHVQVRLWLEKIKTVSLKTIMKFVPPFPSNSFTRNTVANKVSEGPSSQKSHRHPRFRLRRAIAMVALVHAHLLKNTPSNTSWCCSLIPPARSCETDLTISTVSSGY